MKIRKWPWGRIVTGVVAAVILLLAVPLFFTSADIRRRADEAQAADLLRLNADLSKPGVYSGKFKHNFSPAHGNCVQILTGLPSTSYEETAAIVEGMTGCLTITRLDDGVSYKQNFGPKHFESMWFDNATRVPVIRFRCSRETSYELKLAVEKGASRLVGVPHTVVVRYEICGMEYMSAAFLWLIGVAGCSIAGIIILVIVVVTIKKRRAAKRSIALGFQPEELLG